jgi:adenosylcobyric acid synthase
MGKALMVQGTASHVGKSVLVAGLCRLFRQDGLRVAPFKAQNMALNSCATPDGREIGRAQAVQAEAARIAPTVDMNPILLKPEGDARSQVVVEGRVLGSMSAAEYQVRKAELWPIVEASLHRLLDQYDLVVIEGAGSPVEVNLKAGDLVNMRVAQAVQAPVVLVADIDRGGVFAALVGTMELLEPAERVLVAGFVINKFRGDPALFAPGITFLEERLGRPVLGVVPWVDELAIAEEDSLGLPGAHSEVGLGRAVDVAVIRLPHVANFDDFDPLARHPAIGLRYVDRVEQLDTPDLVILPGTKTTRADLAFMQDRGLDRALRAYAARGGALIGICGGYQMLGERIEDLEGVEGEPGVIDGLGLLPAWTCFAAEKATVQVHGRVAAQHGLLAAVAGRALVGYEIHMGRTESRAPAAFEIASADGALRSDGAVGANGRVLGTYLHGLFANRAVIEGLVAALAPGWAGISNVPPPDPYDRLAAVLRRSLDIPGLCAAAGIARV